MTEAEIEAALAANPDVATVLVGALKKRGHVVATQADYEKELEEYKGRIANEKTREVLGLVDATTAEIFGLQKGGDEKTTDFLKRAAQTKLGKLPEYEKELVTLREQVNAGGDAATVKRLQELEAKNSEYAAQIEQLGQSAFQKDVMLEVKTGLAGFKFTSTIPDDVRTDFVSNAVAKLVASAKADGDAIVFTDEKGEVLRGRDRKPLTAAEILTERLKSVLDTGKQQGGAGTGAGDDKGGNHADGDPGTPPATVKTKVELTAWLKTRGLKDGTDDFTKWYKKYSDGLPTVR